MNERTCSVTITFEAHGVTLLRQLRGEETFLSLGVVTVAGVLRCADTSALCFAVFSAVYSCIVHCSLRRSRLAPFEFQAIVDAFLHHLRTACGADDFPHPSPAMYRNALDVLVDSLADRHISGEHLGKLRCNYGDLVWPLRNCHARTKRLLVRSPWPIDVAFEDITCMPSSKAACAFC